MTCRLIALMLLAGCELPPTPAMTQVYLGPMHGIQCARVAVEGAPCIVCVNDSTSKALAMSCDWSKESR